MMVSFAFFYWEDTILTVRLLGQNPPVDGQTAADLSKNNFANACALTLPKVPITNGLQITSGSCNPIPIGQIPSVSNMPSSKYREYSSQTCLRIKFIRRTESPKNLDVIASGQTFTISLQTKGIQLGTFTNAQKTYFANPQKLNAQGQIIGHTHVVMEAIDSLTTTTVTDPTKFFFFKGVNTAQDAQGNVAVDVTGGVTPGAYRMCTIVSSATHQPAIVAIAQHGSLDDCIYVRLVFWFPYPHLSAVCSSPQAQEERPLLEPELLVCARG
jgi:hypothetical protein